MVRLLTLFSLGLLLNLPVQAQLVDKTDYFPPSLMEAERVCSVLVIHCRYMEELLAPREKTFFVVKGGLSEALAFDAKGLLQSRVAYMADTAIVNEMEEFRYDSLGRLKEKRKRFFIGNGTRMQRDEETFWYRSDGLPERHLLKKIRPDRPNLQRKKEETIWHYKEGRLHRVAIAYPNPVEDPDLNWEFVYKKDGSQTIMEYYQDDRAMTQKYWRRQLDEQGRTIRVDRYQGGATRVSSSWRRAFDAQGRIIEESDSGNTLSESSLMGARKRENVYGPKGKLLRSILTFDNGDRRIVLYLYRYLGDG